MFEKIKKHIKNNWFKYILASCCYTVFSVFSGYGGQIRSKKCIVEGDKPRCYIYHGLAQNHIGKGGNKDRLEVRSLIKGFPEAPHSVYIEVIDHQGVKDFLYSEEHTPSHKSHYCKLGCVREYKTFYKIPGRLVPGTYYLLVTFKFKYLFGTKDIVSNKIKFVVK